MQTRKRYIRKRGKLDGKTVEIIIIYYDYRCKGYRILISYRKVIISKTVIFIKDAFWDNGITGVQPKYIKIN